MRDRVERLIRGEVQGLAARWQRGGLRVASWAYGAAVAVRNRLFDYGLRPAAHVPVPIISVGNLTAGGTGKTPWVEWLARKFTHAGYRVCLLSRGYRGDCGLNDEAMALAEELPDVPHLKGRDRALLAAVAAEELTCDVLILDDGFQHRKLKRSLDIVLVDATDPWGGGYLLPCGLLREPPSSLWRADIVVLSKCNLVTADCKDRIRQSIRLMAPGKLICESRYRPYRLLGHDGRCEDPEVLRGRSVAAFCGIGNPEAFRRTLERLGATVVDLRRFPDHHRYSVADAIDLRGWIARQTKDCLVITTHKDLVKLRSIPLRCDCLYALCVEVEVTAGAEELDQKLKEAVS